MCQGCQGCQGGYADGHREGSGFARDECSAAYKNACMARCVMVGAMFIRRTQTRRTEDGKPYFSHRLVHADRLGSSVRQRTLLNLGRHFDIPQADWPLLCARINDALSGQAPLVADCPPAVEEEAQRIAAQLIARGAAAPRWPSTTARSRCARCRHSSAPTMSVVE